MSLIKIIANNIYLDIVTETLTITKENNALINDFKVSVSNFPFLIVENAKTKKALGGKDITSVNKRKTIPVIVEELNQKYYGELQILSYLNGFRKVTLKYSTELIKIMDRNISSFMPVISVIPDETNPIPFTEESQSVIPGFDSWASYVTTIINESYPAVKFNFPMMYWKNKFGNDLQSDDEWFTYKQYINYFDKNENYIENDYSVNDNVITVGHKNVPAPQIYLLSPLFYALESLGWTMEGDFTNSEFIKKIQFLSIKNNLCKTKVTVLPSQLTYPDVPIWTIKQIYGMGTTTYNTFKTELNYTFPTDGKYVFSWMYKIKDTSADAFLWKKLTSVEVTGVDGKILLFYNTQKEIEKTFQGTHEFNVTGGNTINIIYHNVNKDLPIDYFLSILKKDETKDFYQFHPTIDLGRYVPDWTFGTYLNELKKLLNLKIDTDDSRKKLSLNFNDDIIEISEKEILKKSLAIKTYEQPLFDAFHLKYQNNTDTSLWITSEGVEIYAAQKSDFSDKLESKFKFVPNNGHTAELSEALDSKEGVGLMIYNSELSPYISTHYVNQTLTLDGEKGIYKSFWRNWLKFRLNAIPIEMTGYFTEIELSKIQKKLRTYIDRQDYIVSSMEYSETEQANFEVLLKLESVNF